tara:strand:+ start:169 stop:753 length:585 start_codon:yes stop_codon:yes gene_type:complete
MEGKFHYWGPLLISFKLKDDELNQVKKLCSKRSKSYNKNLVGVIKDEYAVDALQYDKIIRPYTRGYEEAFARFRGMKLQGSIRCATAWVNYMKQHEYNPPHTHGDCQLASVLFIKVPQKLKKENEEWKKHNTNYAGPGTLAFFYGTPHYYNIECHEFFPEEGMFYLFPKDLKHFVSPFFSKCERISLAANFVVD